MYQSVCDKQYSTLHKMALPRPLTKHGSNWLFSYKDLTKIGSIKKLKKTLEFVMKANVQDPSAIDQSTSLASPNFSGQTLILTSLIEYKMINL